MDLPGIYSLSPYTLEEVVARNYLITERPDAILNIVDGTNLERNLYLSTQLMELGIPVLMAVNMMDIVQKNGDQININALSKELGCPVVEISALKGTGIMDAAAKAVELAKASGKSAARMWSMCWMRLRQAWELISRMHRNVFMPSSCLNAMTKSLPI